MAESIPSHFVTMASKNKKNASKKNASKSVENENGSFSIHEQNQSTDMTVNKKLDLLLEVVKGLDTKIQEQDVRIQKQEERVSLRDVSALPSAQSSPKQSKDLQPDKLPSFHELKGDSRIQAEVDKRLQAYQNASRAEFSGKSSTVIKSGRFRAGVAKIKNPISWPQDYCAVNVGNKQPTYDEMSLEQWVQGMIFCILEQNDEKSKENMLMYFALLMQDAIELSASTARRAHAAVLQEMERGKLTWLEPDLVEKVKVRNTQRIFQNHKVAPGPSFQTQCCLHFNKGQCKYDNEHMANGTLYQHYCSFCMKETQKKYDHPLTKCLRVKNSQSQSKNDNVKGRQTEQRV